MYHATPRAFSFGELLDAAFTLYRNNFVVFFGTALVPQLPLIVFWLLLPLLFGAVLPGNVEGLASLLTTPYSLFATVLMYGAVTHAAARAYAGEDVSIGESLVRGLHRWVAVGVATLLSILMVFAGLFLLIVPGLILLAMFFAVAPVTVVEERGPIDALGRSRRLSKDARMRILGVLLVAWLITLLPAMAMWVVAGVGAGAAVIAGGDPAALSGNTAWVMAVLQATSSVLTALTWPFLITATLLLYYDRRARTEAPDLEAAAAAL
jgi:hypothetical protein